MDKIDKALDNRSTRPILERSDIREMNSLSEQRKQIGLLRWLEFVGQNTIEKGAV